jgi:hypothetical protein
MNAAATEYPGAPRLNHQHTRRASAAGMPPTSRVETPLNECEGMAAV